MRLSYACMRTSHVMSTDRQVRAQEPSHVHRLILIGCAPSLCYTETYGGVIALRDTTFGLGLVPVAIAELCTSG